jgi:hypothetical protein
MHLPTILMCCFLAGLIRLARAAAAPCQQARRTTIPESSRTDQTITVTTTAWITDELLPLNRRQAPPATRHVLTTTFIPPTGCLSNIYLYNIGTREPYATLGPPEISDCFPPGWSPDVSTGFSPGVCPSGYTAACSTAVTIEYLSETTATCCPRCVCVCASRAAVSGQLKRW